MHIPACVTCGFGNSNTSDQIYSSTLFTKYTDMKSSYGCYDKISYFILSIATPVC